jgi:hypothetical protein
MGFWDWLRPKPNAVEDSDLIWLTRTAKLAGLAVEVKAAGGPVLVLAHFPETLRETKEALAAVGFTGETIDGPLTTAEYPRRAADRPPGSSFFALVSQLRPAEPKEPLGDEPLSVFVAERHFLRTHDDRVKEFAAGVEWPVSITFFLSLDEPLMRMFAGEWVGEVLRKLGLKESEAIKSSMVQRRVAAAQAKFAKSVTVDEPADSAEAWLERSGFRPA